MWNWRVAAIAFLATPLAVLVHELAHLVTLELGGVPAHLESFSAAMPKGFWWNFSGLEQARDHLRIPDRVFAIAALAGPIATLLISYGGLLVYRVNSIYWTTAFAATFRMIGVTLNMPRFISGSIDTSDEAIAAHFLGVPLATVYWPSLLLGYLSIFLLIKSVSRKDRISFVLSAAVSGIIGYFLVDGLVNALILKPAVWTR